MDALGMGHQEMQQPELGRAEFDPDSVVASVLVRHDAVRGGVKAQATHHHHIVGQLRRASRQCCAAAPGFAGAGLSVVAGSCGSRIETERVGANAIGTR